MQNKMIGTVNFASLVITGKTVVAYIHTNARKTVLPMATFLSDLNHGCGTLGAEYKKVITAESKSQCQCCERGKKKTTQPAKPRKKRIR
jgi:hypothetical protein